MCDAAETWGAGLGLVPDLMRKYNAGIIRIKSKTYFDRWNDKRKSPLGSSQFEVVKKVKVYIQSK